MIEYTVAFRIQGADLDPDVVTTDLALEPSCIRRVGDRQGSQVLDKAIWEYNGNPEDENWTLLEDGLLFLLDRLWPLREKIEKYRSKADLFFWIGQFQEDFSGGPTLSPSLLKMLGDFGVELAIDCYFGAETKE